MEFFFPFGLFIFRPKYCVRMKNEECSHINFFYLVVPSCVQVMVLVLEGLLKSVEHAYSITDNMLAFNETWTVKECCGGWRLKGGLYISDQGNIFLKNKLPVLVIAGSIHLFTIQKFPHILIKVITHKT